jgi:hypothetical protein
MRASTEKINYKALFAKLQSKVEKEVQAKTFYPSIKQYPLLDMGGFKEFSNPPAFVASKEVQQFVSSWRNRQTEFVQKNGADPCPGHCKVLLDLYKIDISSSEATLTKNQARTLLKRIFPGQLSSWQIYQFRIKFEIDDESFRNYDYKITKDMLEAMTEATMTCKDSLVPENNLHVVDDSDERSEVDNNHARFKRNRHK